MAKRFKFPKGRRRAKSKPVVGLTKWTTKMRKKKVKTSKALERAKKLYLRYITPRMPRGKTIYD